MQTVNVAGIEYPPEPRAAASSRSSLAYVALGINLAIALPLAAILNIWQDEAYTLQTTGRDFSYAFAHAIGFEQNAPLYFLIITALRHVSDSLFVARLFSIVCIAAALALVPALVARYLPGIAAGWVALALAVNPFTIYTAIDARVYAMIVLVSTLLLIAFYDAFLSTPASGRARATVIWTLLVAVGLYTQYYIAFLVAAQGAVVLWRAPRSFVRYVAAGACALVAFVPLARLIPAQVADFHSGFAPPALSSSFATTGRILAQYVFPVNELVHSRVLYAAVVLAVLAAAVAARRYLRTGGDATAIVMTAVAALLLATALWAEHVVVFVRHPAALFVPALLSVFAFFTFVREPYGARAAAIAAIVCATLSVLVLFSTYRALANPGDWIRVNAYLRGHERPSQPIAVFEAENALPLQYYYRGPNRIVPIPAAVSFERYDVNDFVVHSQAQLERTMPVARSIWFVRAGECRSATLSFGCEIVDRYVASHYRVISSTQFYESTVQLLVPFNERR